MSSSTLRVELPAYSHSFEVQVSSSSTIGDVKLEVARVCPGSPSPVGQRLIWRGRFLKDEEKVEDIWKSPDDSRVIHLAVHPSAWTSTPPTLPSAPSSTPRPQPTPTQPRTSAGQATPTPLWSLPSSRGSNTYPPAPAISFIRYAHSVALCLLCEANISLPPPPATSDVETWRAAAEDFYRSRGWPWPAAFDEDSPDCALGVGAKYEYVTIDGLPYLQLKNPGATPTPAQAHALRVLSHTFAFLSMANDPLLHAPMNPYPPNPYATATILNQRLQDLGLPALRLAHNAANANPNDPNIPNPLVAAGAGGAELRAIPMRALMVPLLMLAFRTLLLLYFFSPSKRPLFGLILSVWILYEAWNAMRMVLNDGNDRGADRAAPNGPAGAGAGQQGAAAVPGLAGPGANGAAPNAAPGSSGFAAVLDRLAMLNLATEDAILDTDAPAPPPSLVQKAKMFVALFFVSLHPAAWDRRRLALRRREGRVRTEANAREAALHDRAQRQGQGGADGQQGQGQGQPRTEEDEARARAREQMVIRHERRPAWLQQYVQRVQYTEWVDDP